MKITRLKASRTDAVLCLLAFLAKKLNISNKKAKRLLDARNVYVNKKRVWMAHHILLSGDLIEVIHMEAPVKNPVKLTVLHKDENYFVVNKPPGILSNGPASIEELLRKQFNEPALLSAHRLDRDTSGCLLLARSSDAFKKITHVFRDKAVNKVYHALISGFMSGGKVQTIKTPIDGKYAVTHVRTVDSNKTASHVIVTIETGRTHQIRKHLAYSGNPVLGDRQYAVSVILPKTMMLTRQMLHSSALEFTNPFTGQRIKTKAPLPHDFLNALKLFGLT